MRWLVILLTIFVVSCTTSLRQNVKTYPASSDNWQIKGRLAATIDKDGGSASFIWNKKGQNHSIELYGPLGSGRVFLTQQGDVAKLIDKDDEYLGETLQEVLFKRTGWLVPFGYLEQWLLGLPQTDHISETEYRDERLIKFIQAGWEVHYQRFELFSDINIPAKMTLTAQPSYLTDLSVRSFRSIDKVRVKVIIKDLQRG